VSRAGSKNFWQAAAAAGTRFNAQPVMLVGGTINSYDPTTQYVTVDIDMGGGWMYTTPPSQLMAPWHGNQFSASFGAVPGTQVLVAVVDPAGNEFVVLGFTSNDPDPGINVPSGDGMVMDPNGNFVNWTADRGGAMRHYGTAFATIFGGQGTEVGGENLDATNDAIIRKSDLDLALSNQVSQIQAEIETWAAAHLQPGSGAPPPTLTAVESTGSSLARAVS
jgi:hypothetical protein